MGVNLNNRVAVSYKGYRLLWEEDVRDVRDSLMPLNPKQLEAGRLLGTGQTYRQVRDATGIPISTLSDLVNKNPEFREVLEETKKQLWIGHQGIVDSYREALVAATQAAPRAVELLLQIAESEDTRTSDKLKALEIILAKPRELMNILDEGKRFPEVALAEEKARDGDEQRLRRKLAQAGWVEVSEGIWSDPKDANNWSYSVAEAYKRVVEVN